MTPLNQDLWNVESIVSHEKCYNIWTMRLTPAILNGTDPTDHVIKMYSDLPESKFPKIIVTKEMKKDSPHFHIRLCCVGWSTRKSLADYVTTWFPDQRGNKLYSTKRVYIRGKSFSSVVKSITYVMKEGDVVYSRGYPDEQLDLFHRVGSSWKDIKSLPIYKKIIELYNINVSSTGKYVATSIIEYYEKEHKDIPSRKSIQRIMFLIKWNVSTTFRQTYIMHAANEYDNVSCFM